MIEMIVVMMIPRSRPPGTFITINAPMSRTPITKMSVGTVVIELPKPSWTGVVVPAASGIRRTNPASTNPMNATKQPIPAAIAAFSSAGTALNTAVRNPVIARMTMMMPSTTTSPIASGQVTSGTMVTASRLLMPRPVAMAKG